MSYRRTSSADPLEIDAALVPRIRAGDETAFEILFRSYFAPLASLAFAYVHSREIAEELVQDVLLRIWEGRTTLEIRDNIRAYLYTAVRHRAIGHLRRHRVAQRIEDEATEAALDDGIGWGGAFATITPATDATVEASEFEAAIERAIASLPARCRETFVLARQHELSQAEIAIVMGTTIKTVQAQMYKARALLRQRLAAWLD